MFYNIFNYGERDRPQRRGRINFTDNLLFQFSTKKFKKYEYTNIYICVCIFII